MNDISICPALMKYWATLEKRNIHLPRQAIRSDAAIIHEIGRLSIAQGELDNFSSSRSCLQIVILGQKICVETSRIFCFNNSVQKSFHFCSVTLSARPALPRLAGWAFFISELSGFTRWAGFRFRQGFRLRVSLCSLASDSARWATS